MSAVAERAGSFQRHRALSEANRIKDRRYRLRVEARHVARTEGVPAGQAVIADAIVESPEWLVAAEALDVLSWAPRVGPALAGRLYALTGSRKAHRLGELSPRQRLALAEGLRGLGGER